MECTLPTMSSAREPFRPGAIRESIYNKHAVVNPFIYFAFIYK